MKSESPWGCPRGRAFATGHHQQAGPAAPHPSRSEGALASGAARGQALSASAPGTHRCATDSSEAGRARLTLRTTACSASACFSLRPVFTGAPNMLPGHRGNEPGFRRGSGAFRGRAGQLLRGEDLRRGSRLSGPYNPGFTVTGAGTAAGSTRAARALGDRTDVTSVTQELNFKSKTRRSTRPLDFACY